MAQDEKMARIEDLLLDPNNYRFVDLPDYKKISDGDAGDPNIQKRVLGWLLGKNNENVNDLIASFRANGYLNLDQIQVKRLNDKFLVLEGNRRVATLKFLHSEYEKSGKDLKNLQVEIFDNLPIVLHENEETKSHLLAMGLHHISGKKRWSTVNQANFVRDMRDVHHMSEQEICDALGITKHYFRRSLRTLSLIDLYKESDYGDQFSPEKYSLFEEIIKRTEVKSWLGWAEDGFRPTNMKRMEQLFSWISIEEISDEEHGNAIRKLEPIITKSHEIRELSKFLSDPKAIEKMELSRSLAVGYAASTGGRGIERLQEAISNIEHEVQAVFGSSNLLDADMLEWIKNIQEKLGKIVPSGFGFNSGGEARAELISPFIAHHFSEISIIRYRKLNSIKLRNVSQVNLIVGANNSGKTTLLESIYLLANLNNLNGVLELERLRGRFNSTISSQWIDRNFKGADFKVEGVFNSKQVTFGIRQEVSEEPMNKAGYLSSIAVEAIVEGASFDGLIHLFSNRNAEFNFSQSRMLCRVAFSSPYRSNSELLLRAHSDAIIEKQFDNIVNFIHDNLDDGIQKIELLGKEQEFRFYVDSTEFKQSLDLTKYGEGLQRIFEIALLMVYCRNGILCIDELETAIHRSLLLKFTAFIEKFARDMNVQVFASTHSKECIDAFVQNEIEEDNITAYQLAENSEGSIECRYLEAAKLKLLIETMNLDIR
jgi:AAA15 family ATPase/GTPase